ncbi:MAG: DUF7681 family protein [Thalassovita sp.]
MSTSKPHAGLPVAGYAAQKENAVAKVNESKHLEERVLRFLDELAADAELAADPRWFAIGRTNIEQGFMAVNRAVFKPSRVCLPEEGAQ